MTVSLASPRFPPLAEEAMNEAQREMAAKIRSFSLNGLKGPHAVLIRTPEAAARFQQLGEYLRFGTALPARLVELAVLVHARLWNAGYEWMLHESRAAEAGISADAIAAIKLGRVPADLAADEATILRFVLALERDRHLDDALFDEAKRQLGEQPLADLTIMLGHYATISMLLVLAGAGDAPPLPAVTSPFANA